jgi:hypothetical protein
MGKEEHRFYFSSSHSISNSNTSSFTVNLPFSLDLAGRWKCTIYEVFIDSADLSTESLYILSDFCETSLLEENKQLPILRKLYLSPNKKFYNFPHLLYIPLKQVHLTNFTLSFLDTNLQKINTTDLKIECTLHFYKYG